MRKICEFEKNTHILVMESAYHLAFLFGFLTHLNKQTIPSLGEREKYQREGGDGGEGAEFLKNGE